MQDDARIERLIGMAERLVVALQDDIAALEKGRPGALRTAEPEIQRLTAMYGREAQGFDVRLAQAAPAPLRSRFVAITAKFRDMLQLHTRLLARVKNASEGMVKAIADEVNRINAPARTYGPRPGAVPQSSGAMVYNSVV
jgi:hypothetical protein